MLLPVNESCDMQPKEANVEIMKPRSVLPMKIAKYGYIAISIVFCLVGVALMVFPAPSARTIAIFCGVAMLVFGAVRLVGYFSRDLFRLAFQFDLQFGILLIVMGVITLMKPDDMMNFLCISMGVCILADCLFKARIAMDAKRFGIREWWLTMGLAVITGVIGLLLAFRPSNALHAILILLGVSLLSDGILNLSVAVSLVKIVNHQQPDVIDAEYYNITEEN